MQSIGECRFWSSDKLTGSQTVVVTLTSRVLFWSSDKLTGSQTTLIDATCLLRFWSSDKLTGSQTVYKFLRHQPGFGAVTN